MNRREGPSLARLCEKSEVQFKFRISVSISSGLKTNSASNCRREMTTKKTILRFFCRCDFSPSLGPKRRPTMFARIGFEGEAECCKQDQFAAYDVVDGARSRHRSA